MREHKIWNLFKGVSGMGIIILISILFMQTGCDQIVWTGGDTSKDSLQQKKTVVQPQHTSHGFKDTGKRIAAPKSFSIQQLSLGEVGNLLTGTWAPADGDTVPYFCYETYRDGQRYDSIKHHSKDSAYIKICEDDTLKYRLLSERPSRISEFPCLCYISLEGDAGKYEYMAILRITRDSLFLTDGKDKDYYNVCVKVH